MTTLASEFGRYAATKLRDNLRQIEKCLALLDEQQVWMRPNAASNAIGNLVLHLTGNVRQWIISSIGGQSFKRERPAEFAERGPLPTLRILEPLQASIAEAASLIEQLPAARLLDRLSIQGYELSVVAAIFHVVEHCSLHTGQIVYQTKALTGLDLSAYDEHGHRIDGRNTGVP